jgi:prevent-host-death family protein
VQQYMSASEARGEFSEMVSRVAYGGERFVIRRRDKELAAVIPMEEYRILERLIEREEDRIDAEEAMKVAGDPGYVEESVLLEQIRKELGL